MKTARAALPAALIAVCAVFVAGCAERRPPGRSLDESIAREALVEALESWKSGRPHAEPSESHPSLRVADEDWLAGRHLAEYRILPGEQVIGSSLSCPVVLVIDGPDGRPRETTAAYLVSTDPELSVIRSD